MGTLFTTVYDRFLSKVTDDLYIELTPQDTRKDLQTLLINQLSNFEFPRKNLFNYSIELATISMDELTEDDFVIESDEENETAIIEASSFTEELTHEEIEILAILMMCAWVQRQVTSIEQTRMKYSGTDFKFTSQANQLQKLLTTLGECQRQSHHMQRLYKRRRTENDLYRSNWDIFKPAGTLF